MDEEEKPLNKRENKYVAHTTCHMECASDNGKHFVGRKCREEQQTPCTTTNSNQQQKRPRTQEANHHNRHGSISLPDGRGEGVGWRRAPSSARVLKTGTRGSWAGLGGTM